MQWQISVSVDRPDRHDCADVVCVYPTNDHRLIRLLPFPKSVEAEAAEMLG